MPKARIGDLDMYYEVDGEGPWLVMVHGGGDTHMGWWKQVYALRDRYRCVTCDMRGSGQTTDVGAPLNATAANAAASKDLLGLLNHLKIDKAFVNGWSAGGHAVSGLAQQHPDRVQGLVMTSTPFGFQTDALRKWAGQMIDKFQGGFDIRAHSWSSTFAQRDPAGEALLRTMMTLNAGARPANVADYRKRFNEAYSLMRDTPAKDYRGFKTPTLFIAGGEDELTVPWLVRDTAKVVGPAGSPVVEIPGVGHSGNIEKPGIYNAILMSFLDGIAAPAAA